MRPAPAPPDGRWYVSDAASHPKEDYMFDLAIGDGMWDPRAGFDGSFGACDLVWYPGWTLRLGWPNVGYDSWPASQS